MTQLSDEKNKEQSIKVNCSLCSNESCEKRDKPIINTEEDRPFEIGSLATKDQDLLKQIEQQHNHDVENFKNTASYRIILAGSAVIVAVSVVQACMNKDVSALNNLFEFAKTLVTISIGYLFADSKKK